MALLAKAWRIAAIMALVLTFLVYRASPGFASTPPVNDDFSNATLITTTPFTTSEDTTAATTAPDDPATCGTPNNTVWFAVTPSASGVIVAIPSASYPAVISAYTGLEGALSQVACGAELSTTQWTVTAGVTYHIMVSSLYGVGGLLNLQVDVDGPPANDDFDGATDITTTPFTATEDITAATAAPDDPTSCFGTANSVWFSFTAPVTETALVTATADRFLPGVSAYTGSEGSLTQVACAGFDQTASWSAVAGMTYHIMVVATGSQPSGPMTLQLNAAQPPANDDFDDAATISSLPFTTTEDTLAATTAPDDPTECGADNNSVWFRMTPAVNEQIFADTAGSSYSPSVSVYTGAEGSLSTVACGTPFEATAGVTYFILVANSRPSNSAGQLVFNLQGFPPPPNDNIGQATVITSLPYTNNIDTTAATTVTGDPTCIEPPHATVWYRFTAPSSGSVMASTGGSNYPATVSMYTGSPAALTQIACAFGSTDPVSVSAGVTYYIEASSFISPTGGNLQFSLTGISDGPGPCTTSLTGSIPNGVTVTAGTTCVNAATVHGAVTVRPGAELLLTNSTITGSVSSDASPEIEICNSTIDESLLLNRPTGFMLVGFTTSGECGGNKVRGNILITGSAAESGGVRLTGNSVTGQVIVTDNHANPASVLVPQDATIDIGINQIRGSLVCAGNTPPPINGGLPNNVGGARTGQCTTL